MGEVVGINKLLSIVPRKRLGRFSLFGTIQMGFSNFGDDDIFLIVPGGDSILLSGIYRTDNVTGETKYYREPFYIPSNPRTAAQQSQRMKYAAGIVAWQSLTDEQKNVYNQRALQKKFSGYNLFLKEYLLSH